MLDLLSTVELTASAAIVAATLSFVFGQTPRERGAILLALTAWFVTVLWLGATDALHYARGIGTPGLAVAVVLPVVILTALALGTREGRARVVAAPLPALIAVQAVRVLGVSFVLLYQAERLPAPFAPVAGWGDILVGALALPVAWLVSRERRTSGDVAMVWNLVGIADLVAAVGLGAASSPGPIRIFTQGPDSAIMTGLPWIIIPCFLVPALAAVHLVTFYKLRERSERSVAALGAL